MSQSESENLTRVRALQELKTKKRTTIKGLIGYLIHWADEQHNAGLLQLPISRDVPELELHETIEKISYVTSEDDRAALARLFVDSKGRELEYGEADIIRQILKIAELKLFRDII